MSAAPTVFIVDDDDDVRESLVALFTAARLPVEAFASAEAFVRADATDRCGCLILDLHMPGASGIELQAELSRRGSQLPVIFLTAHADIPASVRAMRAGATDFLVKPQAGERLLDRVREVLARSMPTQTLWGRLTARERVVLARLACGQSSKVIAAELGISQRTVEGHRGCLMRKLDARNALELLNAARGFDLAAFTPSSQTGVPLT